MASGAKTRLVPWQPTAFVLPSDEVVSLHHLNYVVRCIHDSIDAIQRASWSAKTELRLRKAAGDGPQAH